MILLVLFLIANKQVSDNSNKPLAADTDYPIIQTADGVFYHQGIHQDATKDNIGAIGNMSFVVGDTCVAVIDSGGSYLEGVKLRHAVASQTDLPVCYVINTHTHPDHVFGNAAFKADNPQFVGHEKLAAAMQARQTPFERTFKALFEEDYDGIEFITPTLTVSIDTPLTIDLGNRPLTFTAYTTAHTDHDITVHDQKSNTFWTGDLLFMERIPVLDGNLTNWLKIMTQFQQADYDVVIPGHGTASADQWRSGLAKQQHYFETIRDEVREIIADFGTIQQAIEQVGLSEKDNWELFPQYHRRNVTATFTELEWE
jgi:quinoprotein relay system zinc metallohydrolase 2